MTKINPIDVPHFIYKTQYYYQRYVNLMQKNSPDANIISANALTLIYNKLL